MLQAPSEPKKYTTVYNDFKGVDFTSDATRVWKKRSPTGLNMTPDLNGMPWKRTGWKIEITQADFQAAYEYGSNILVKNMYSFELAGQDHLIIFCNCGVFAYTEGQLTHLVTLDSITDEPYRGFFFEGNGDAGFYFFGNKEIYAYKYNDAADTFSCGEVSPYIPTTLIGRSATGGGTIYEGVNLLTRRRKEAFLGDDTSTVYYLAMGIDPANNVVVKVKDSSGEYQTLTDGYTINHSLNTVTFSTAKPPVPTGEDNILIEYTASTASGAVDAFFDSKAISIYGTGVINSVFVGGCSDDNFSSRVWYSAVGRPNYFPDLNYFIAGSNDTKIMGLIKVGEYLGVVKQGNNIDSTIYLAYPISFDDDTAYAVKQAVTGIGALSNRCFASLEDESLFLSAEGVMAIEPSSNENERQVKNRSYFVNKRLLAESNLQNAFAYVWNGFYMVCVNSHIYLLDSSQKQSWANEKTNLQYECYYWDNIPATCFATYNDFLYFGDTSGRVCRIKTFEADGAQAYSDDGSAISCEWSTILDNDGATNFFKNLQKKGCLITIAPLEDTSVEVSLKADDKAEIGLGNVEFSNVTIPQEIYLNKKVKKYKRLQIIVRNNVLNQGFGIHEIIKVYTIGNYSK